MKCEIILERRIEHTDTDYEESGNVMLDRLFDAQIRHAKGGSDMNAELEKVAEEVRGKGGNPYVIPGGGSNPIGALGYVNCALELLQQANDLGLRIDHVVHATGSTGTQAGLVTGFSATNSGVPVLGISVRLPKDRQEAAVHDLTSRTADYVGVKGGVGRDKIAVEDGYYGQGYGIPTPEMVEAVEMTARHEGILLDPVYTGKGMAGLIGLVRKGHFAKTDNVVFIHTGGSVGLFGYRKTFAGNNRPS
jgi:L-cysteate sulfo-lyase